MKLMTICGTRPEIIRLSRVIPKLDQLGEHILVTTGQNADPNLSDVFFQELEVRSPDEHMGVDTSSFAQQAGDILKGAAQVLEKHRPDRLLILGDTNSGLSAIVAARMRIPVYHMEAGNRCYDDRVPEEINRRLIDHSSDVLMPYTHRSKENLIREGFRRERIFVTGNPIFEVLKHYENQIDASPALEDHGVQQGQYFLVTLHRAENVDEPPRLERLLCGLSRVAEEHGLPMLVSTHPRTADKLRRFGLAPESQKVRLLDPLPFFAFVRLEKSARCVLSDSGTVQEECAIFGVPNVTLRDATERAETTECGSNLLAGSDPEAIAAAVRAALALGADWTAPAEYLDPNVSRTVAKIVLGY